jgi:hypothetical protein
MRVTVALGIPQSKHSGIVCKASKTMPNNPPEQSAYSHKRARASCDISMESSAEELFQKAPFLSGVRAVRLAVYHGIDPAIQLDHSIFKIQRMNVQVAPVNHQHSANGIQCDVLLVKARHVQNAMDQSRRTPLGV